MTSKTWETVTLGQYIKTQKGYAFKSKWYIEKGVPIVKVSNFTDDSIDTSDLVCVSEEIAEAYSKHKLKRSDIIIQTVGSWQSNPQSVVGKVIKVPSTANGALLNQNAVKIIPDKHIYQTFLYYVLKNNYFKDYIIGCAQGAASQASITLDAIREFAFQLPPLETQQKIAGILSAYDDLIENNNRRIEILEEMARSLYREWFVNFRFPGHKQTRFVDSELGQIPEGWHYTKIKDLPIQIVDGDRSKNYPKRSEFVDNGILFLNTKNIVANKINLAETNFITTEKFAQIKKGRVEPLDIVMTTRGSIGKVALFNCEYSKALINAQMLILRTQDDEIKQLFLFHSICSDEFQNLLMNFSSGAAQPQIPITDLKEVKILCPSLDVQCSFSEKVYPNTELIKALQVKNTNLRKTRDLLLSKLISGEIDVEMLDINTGEIAA